MFRDPTFATWADYLQQGSENRTELKSAQMQVQAGESAYKIARAGRYPVLALSAGYVNAYLPNVLTVTNALNGGLALQYNISGAFHSKHVVQEAKARQRQAEISRLMTEDRIHSEIREKFLNYQKANEKLLLTQQSIVQAKENFTITKNKFDLGLVILSDYLDADVTLLQSQINNASARAERMIAYYELEESAGNLQ
jgi:outer membrane protein TolC